MTTFSTFDQNNESNNKYSSPPELNYTLFAIVYILPYPITPDPLYKLFPSPPFLLHPHSGHCEAILILSNKCRSSESCHRPTKPQHEFGVTQ